MQIFPAQSSDFSDRFLIQFSEFGTNSHSSDALYVRDPTLAVLALVWEVSQGPLVVPSGRGLGKLDRYRR